MADTQFKLKNLFFLNLQKHLWHTALQQEAAIAMWQLPNNTEQHLLIDIDPQLEGQKIDLNEAEPGFMVSPFINPKLQHSYFIKSDIYLSSQKENLQILEQEDEQLLKPSERNFRQCFLQNLSQGDDEVSLPPNLPGLYYGLAPQELEKQYPSLVSKGIASIKQRTLDKVVLSRPKLRPYPSNFSPLELFRKLCKVYPTAFIYAFYLPKIGFWMGASPETLISVDQHRIFRTVALAGTQAYQEGMPLNQVSWTQKEIEEQALVSRYIINCFKKIRLREFEEEGPKTVRAGNLLHLKTNFKVDMQATNFPQLANVMLELLHPTSAVCGMPLAEAETFILENEGYPRGFYSGFLGPVNIANSTDLFVNLRCMQLLSQHICLYAGAGITEDSIPEKELRETEIKCQTLSKHL